jgi:hypothetical protein
MKNKSDPDMKPEYDFSGARRSRYAARLTDQDRREILSRSAALDAQLHFAHALQQVQELEAMLVAIFVLGFNQTLEAAGEDAGALLEGRDFSVLARLTARAGPSDFPSRFRELTAGRNWLVHKSGFAMSPAVRDPEAMADLVTRLEAVRDQAAALSSELTAILHSWLVASGLTPGEIRQRTAATIEQWLAA